MRGNLRLGLIHPSQRWKPSAKASAMEAWIQHPLTSGQQPMELGDPGALDIEPINQQILTDHLRLDQRAPHFSFERAITNNNLCTYKIGQHTKLFRTHYAPSVLPAASLGNRYHVLTD